MIIQIVAIAWLLAGLIFFIISLKVARDLMPEWPVAMLISMILWPIFICDLVKEAIKLIFRK